MKTTSLYAFGLMAVIAVSGCATGQHNQTATVAAAAPIGVSGPIFDGQTLNGWIDQENSAATIGGGDITNFDGFVSKLSAKSDPVSAYLNGKLDETNRNTLAEYSSFSSPTNANARAFRSALMRNLNKIISSNAVYSASRFRQVRLRPETIELLAQKPKGFDRTRLNKLLFEDAYPNEVSKGSSIGWIVKDGAIASTGAGRGTLYTAADYGHYRITFLMRHVSGKPDHQPCVLVFCTRPNGGKPLDAIGGIQFQVPNGGHWDYRPGHNNGGSGFTNPIKTKYDNKEWSQVEILVDASKGIARMAVAQPPGSKAVENLDFNVPDAGKIGPFALQMHNGGLFDEFKDFKVEVNPEVDDLITVK